MSEPEEIEAVTVQAGLAMATGSVSEPDEKD